MSNGILNILFQRPADAERIALGLVARILPLSLGVTSSVVEAVVPADSRDPRSFSVVPGTYAIQLFLPSGAMLQEVREVRSGQAVEVTFEGEPPKHSWMGGSSFVGQPATEPVPEPKSSPRPARSRPTGAGTGSARAVLQFQDQQPRAARSPRRARAVAKLHLLGRDALSGARSWQILSAPELRHFATQPLGAPEAMEGSLGLWRFGAGERPYPPAGSWILVETPQALEVVRLPAPWDTAPGDKEAPGTGPHRASVELMVDADQGYERAASSVSVRDQRLGGLLAYLDRGRLGAVRSLVEALDHEGLITATIQAKLQNPLAACAAAYVGLAIFEPNEQERWDSWLPNLMNMFPDIPDGAVLHARRIMLRPNGPQEGAEMGEALRRAFAAGIPYFGAGLDLMRGMMLALAKSWPEGPSMLEAVSRTASRVDTSQAFTVLRYPRSAE